MFFVCVLGKENVFDDAPARPHQVKISDDLLEIDQDGEETVSSVTGEEKGGSAQAMKKNKRSKPASNARQISARDHPDPVECKTQWKIVEAYW